MRDPLEELKQLDVGGPAPHLSAAEVRRRGDRLHRRRTAFQAAGAAAAVAVVALGGGLAAGQLSSVDAPVGPVAPATSSPPAPPSRLDDEPSPAQGEQPDITQIPAGFPIEEGLPPAGGDVPDWTWSRRPTAALPPVACGGEEHLPVAPVDSLRVVATPPDERALRLLLLFKDEEAASRALTQLRASALACAKLAGGGPASGDPAEMRWSVTDTDGRLSPGLAVKGLMYAVGTDVRVPGRTLTRVIRVGNALLVARVDDASSATGQNATAHSFEAAVRGIAEDMCVFAPKPCVRP